MSVAQGTQVETRTQSVIAEHIGREGPLLPILHGIQEEFGCVPIDNNASEREMKRIVLNRKNSLFVGNERAGRSAAILSSLASTCRRHDLDPQRYLTQLLINLPATPLSQLERWLPDEWKRRHTPPPG